MKILNKVLTLAAAMAASSSGLHAATIIGGDAVDQASAGAILDIVFAIDTSSSMQDDIGAIGAAAARVISTIQCPEIDVYVRARFVGITQSQGIFNENVRALVIAAGGSPLSNSSEDNGPVVSDIINNSSLFFTNDATGLQDYYQAIVTIGDEGTQDGAPAATAADWDAARQANTDAVNSNTLLFSWITDPQTGVPEVFGAMAEGGSSPFGGADLAATGGILFQTTGTEDVAATLEEIICKAGTGGEPPNGVPDGGTTFALFGLVISGLAGARRFLSKK